MIALVGGAAGTRTPYLNTASVALSRMSYSPALCAIPPVRLVGPLSEATRRPLAPTGVHGHGSRASSTTLPPRTLRRLAGWVYYSRSTPH
jgi:hypothetical protein